MEKDRTNRPDKASQPGKVTENQLASPSFTHAMPQMPPPPFQLQANPVQRMENNNEEEQEPFQMKAEPVQRMENDNEEEPTPFQMKADPVQRMGNDNEEEPEPFQMKAEMMQRMENDNEEEPEPFQMKAETVQRIGNDNEEEPGPFQMKTEPVQRMGIDNEEAPKPFQLKPNKTGMPDNLKAGIENLSGYSMDNVKVNYNSPKPATLQAHAYAQGEEIHLGPGQEKHLPHEAWHVVQQKQGRVQPTMQLKGKVNVNDDAGLEKEADLMGEKGIQFTTGRVNRVTTNPKGSPFTEKPSTLNLKRKDSNNSQNLKPVQRVFCPDKNGEILRSSELLERCLSIKNNIIGPIRSLEPKMQAHKKEVEKKLAEALKGLETDKNQIFDPEKILNKVSSLTITNLSSIINKEPSQFYLNYGEYFNENKFKPDYKDDDPDETKIEAALEKLENSFETLLSEAKVQGLDFDFSTIKNAKGAVISTGNKLINSFKNLQVSRSKKDTSINQRAADSIRNQTYLELGVTLLLAIPGVLLALKKKPDDAFFTTSETIIAALWIFCIAVIEKTKALTAAKAASKTTPNPQASSFQNKNSEAVARIQMFERKVKSKFKEIKIG